jgi:hypothetical protein
MYVTFAGTGGNGDLPKDHLIDAVVHVMINRNIDSAPLSAIIYYKDQNTVIRSSGRLTIWHRDGRTTIYDLIGEPKEVHS